MSDDHVFQAALEERRKVIDLADANLLEAFAKRFEATDAVGRLKASEGVAIYDPAREEKLLKAIAQLSDEYNLDPVFLQSVWQLILEESRKRQAKETQ